MVSTLGALVLFLTCAGSTIGQRKVSRNISVGTSEVKYTVNFDCPDEFGYYPHPTDCTQYYVCVFGGALLESCTGGLMYSHELQTCDWPRNVGCDGTGEVAAVKATVSSSSTPSRSSSTESRTRYAPRPPPPPPAQPAAVVTSRGQPRQLHHNQQQQEIIKSHQLYAEEEEEALPPPSEEISDRQQRFYRGQPSTLGQVQRDRDGIRHSNAIPSYSGRGEKIGVISFGTQQQQLQPYSDLTDVSNNDLTNDVTLTRRKIRHKRQAQRSRHPVEPAWHGGNPHKKPFLPHPSPAVLELQPPPFTSQSDWKPGFHYDFVPVVTQQQRVFPNYYANPNDDSYAYYNFEVTSSSPKPPVLTTPKNSKPPQTQIQSNQKYRLANDREKPRVTEAITKSYSPKLYKEEEIRYNNQEIPELLPYQRNRYENVFAFADPNFDFDKFLDTFREPERKLVTTTATPAVVKTRATTEKIRTTTLSDYYEYYEDEETEKPKPKKVKTEKPLTVKTTTLPPDDYYYDDEAYDEIEVSTKENPSSTVMPKFSAKFNKEEVVKPVLARPVTYEYAYPIGVAKTFPLTTTSTSTLQPPVYTVRQRITSTTKATTRETTKGKHRLRLSNTTDYDTKSNNTHRLEDSSVGPQKIAATVAPKTVHNGSQHYDPARYEQYYFYDDDIDTYRDLDYSQHYNANNADRQTFRGTPATTSHLSSTPKETTKRRPTYIQSSYTAQDVYPSADYNEDNTFGQVDDQSSYRQTSQQPSRGDRNELNYVEEPSTTKRAPTITRTTTTTTTTTTPRPIPSQKSTVPSRTSSRGRGSAHYSSAGIVEAVNVNTVNRGTAPPRSRPTLKPSTSIVSKAAEYVDIYRYPPRRPDPIYPQPQPDKTAAKCRKDVCLLPDCSCGGKEIPGDLPVEQVPQIVLLTYDDSVNDLNKGLYSDLFEKGRVNPNGCPIAATFYVSHEWTDYSQVQNLYADGHEIASHTVSHSFGEQFSQKKWTREVAGQREILSAYGGVKLEDVRGMRAPFLSVGGNKMFKMLYDSNFTFDSSMPIYENKPPSWPYTLDYKLFHDCMIPPCPTRSYPGVWEVPMVMWQDLNGGRCSMGDACSNPADAEGVFKLLMKNFQRHYTTNRAPFGLFYHAAWFTQPHHKEGFITFLDTINAMKDVYLVTNWQAIQWVREPTPLSQIGHFQPFQCNYPDRPKRCNNPKVCNLWHKSGVRYMRTCQPCPDIYPWTGNTGIRSSRIDNDIED